MKVIQPVTIWSDGQVKQATILSVVCSLDNLSNSASFQYTLLESDTVPLTNGILYMSGDVYKDWQTNEYAYDWAAEQLNLTIIRDWTTTTTTSTTSTTTTIAPTTSTTTSTTTKNILTSTTTTTTTKP